MKLLFSALLLCLTTNAFARPQPVREPVEIKNQKFAEAITKAIEKNVTPREISRTGGKVLSYTVGNGLQCTKSTVTGTANRGAPTYKCRILGDAGWNYLGSECYGSGDNEAFSLALYAALDVKAKSEAGITVKVIEMDIPDPRGGTERNQLSCTIPSAEMKRMGLRSTCQLLNAL